MKDLRLRGAAPRDSWSEPLDEYDASAYDSPPRFEGRPPRRSGDAGGQPGRRPPQRPPDRDETRLNRPPRRPSDAGFGVNGPPRGPLGSGPQWPEPGDEEGDRRPAHRTRRPPVAEWEPGPGARSPRQKRPAQKKLPLTPLEKRRRWLRYAALLGVMLFASVGGASLSYNLVALGVLSLVFCLPCAALFLYL